jgi:hypothetical protein
MIHTTHTGKMSAMRNQLRYLSLAVAVRPRFKHLLKIQHRLLGWVALNPVAVLKAKRGLRRSEAMPVNSKFPDLGFKRLSRYA